MSPVRPLSGCRCESYAILLLIDDGGGRVPCRLLQALHRHMDVHGFFDRVHGHREVRHAFPVKSAFLPQVHLVTLVFGLTCNATLLHGRV